MRRDDTTFDPLLLSRVRLGVVSILATRKKATFSDLRALLQLTQGNLGAHLRKLEDGGYISVEKGFVRRKPQTTCRLTAKGRRSFLTHVEQLAAIAKKAEGG